MKGEHVHMNMRNMWKQKTVNEKVVLKGVGLHSGQKVRCVIHPAPANHGIIFLRSDILSLPRIKADISKVSRTDMCTTLANDGIQVATVEHIMAALAGLGIDNAIIEVDAAEIPIMDGSSKEFVDAVLAAGIREQSANKKVLRLNQAVSVRAGDKWIEATPSDHLSIKGSISFAHKVIGDQIFRYNLEKDFVKEISSARTFGFAKEVAYLHKKGLALGGSLENAIVLDEEKVLNPEGLRYKNEFIRHKILDAIGDLALLGTLIEASIEIHKSGHDLHAAFLRKVLSDPSYYTIVELGTSRDDAKEDAAEVETLQPSLVHAY